VEVIGAGPSRTGTNTMKVALRMLGYKATDGGFVFFNKTVQKAWLPWLTKNTSFEPALRTLLENGYNATLHEPFSLAYLPLLRRFPDAKVILTVRDSPEDWFASVKRALEWSHNISKATVELTNRLYRAYDCEVWEFANTFGAVPDVLRWRCIFGYKNYIANVRRKVPPDRLLVFNVKEGWEPLCRFLGVPVPREPWPKSKAMSTTTPKEFLQIYYTMFLSSKRRVPFHLGLCLCCSLFCWRLWRRRQAALASAGGKDEGQGSWALGFWSAHAGLFLVGLLREVSILVWLGLKAVFDPRLHWLLHLRQQADDYWKAMEPSVVGSQPSQ